MRRQTKLLAQGALIAALYALLCHGQNFILPGSGSLGLQVRVAESLCVLAYFTPAAVPGLSLGCLLFNLTSGAGLPLDFLFGTLASLLAAFSMKLLKKYPIPALALPALLNGLLVGLELTIFAGGGFGLNALYVAAGELIALYGLGLPLYLAIQARKLQNHLFS